MAYFDFSKISEWASDTQLKIAEETVKVARTVLYNVITESPYSTGRFLGNWQIGPNKNSYSLMTKATHEQKLQEITYTLTDDYFLIHKSIFIVNNVAYAKNVEELGWQRTGKYAPVAKTLAKFNALHGGGSV